MSQKRRNLNEKIDGIFGNDVHKIGRVGTVLRRVHLSKFYGIFCPCRKQPRGHFTKNLDTETFVRHCDAMGLEDDYEVVAPKIRNRNGVEMGGMVVPTQTWIANVHYVC